MTQEEALAWLRGERSLTNVIPQDPLETWTVRIVEADAAMTAMAYQIARAHKDGLFDTIETARREERDQLYILLWERMKALQSEWGKTLNTETFGMVEGLCWAIDILRERGITDQIETARREERESAMQKLIAEMNRLEKLGDAYNNATTQFLWRWIRSEYGDLLDPTTPTGDENG